MTKEEAIKRLKSFVEVRRKYFDMQTMKDEIECLDMAIKALEAQPSECEYCHEDSDGYIKPLEKNCHTYIRFGMQGWVIELKAKGWRGKVPIKFCPMCGRRLTDGRFN